MRKKPRLVSRFHASGAWTGWVIKLAFSRGLIHVEASYWSSPSGHGTDIAPAKAGLALKCAKTMASRLIAGPSCTS